jgi:peptidoglycan/xylan/chitin deacetylase (PgdA/CDA1 family)
MRKFVRILVVLVTLGVAVPAVSVAASRAPAATTAYTYPLPSVAYVKATKANGEVIVLSRAYRIWISTQAWGVYAGARGQLQYRTPGTATWLGLKEYTTDGRGHSTYVDRSGLAREYRTVLRATPYVLPRASATGVITWCSVPVALRGKDLTRVPTSNKVVALTFDAGANGDAVGSILSTLRSKGVPATFFLTGRFATTFPDLTRTIMSRYPTGNHSDTHPDLTKMSLSNALLEVRRGQLHIRAVGGHDPHPYGRFPFGAVNSSLVDLVNQECYVSFRWTVDTLGWQGTSGGMTAAKVRDRVLAGLTPGEIVLMHVGSHPTDHSMLDAAALPSVIDALRARGYGFVTLESVIADW